MKMLLLAATATIMLLLGGCKHSGPPATQAQAEPVQPYSVNALGRLEPRGSTRSISAAAGIDGTRVGKLFVEEGDTVIAGQPLFSLDNVQRLQATLKQALATEQLSAARLEQAKAGAKSSEIAAQQALVKRLESEKAIAETQFRRTQELCKSGDFSARECEQRRLNFENAKREITRAQAQLTTLENVRPVDVEVARKEHELNRAATKRVLSDIHAATIVAPVSGVILRIYNRPGEVASTKVLDLGETKQMVVMAEVYEADIRRVRIGQVAEIKLPTLGDMLKGKVERIGQVVGKREVINGDPAAETDARIFRVQIALDPRSTELAAKLSNMQVGVHILP